MHTSMLKLNSKKVIKLLIDNDGSYIKSYYQGGSVYADDGYEIGTLTERVFDNLLKNNQIREAGTSDFEWNVKYYRLNKL